MNRLWFVGNRERRRTGQKCHPFCTLNKRKNIQWSKIIITDRDIGAVFEASDQMAAVSRKRSISSEFLSRAIFVI